MNIKFRMPKFGRDMKLTGMTKELTMSTLATTISIILTFGTAHWLEQREAEQSRKLLAMTAINDIDESITVLKRLKFNEERDNAITRPHWYCDGWNLFGILTFIVALISAIYGIVTYRAQKNTELHTTNAPIGVQLSTLKDLPRHHPQVHPRH